MANNARWVTVRVSQVVRVLLPENVNVKHLEIEGVARLCDERDGARFHQNWVEGSDSVEEVK